MMQKRRTYSLNTGLSLIQPNDGRELLLEKMREKLAGSSMVHLAAAEKRRVAVRKSTLSWGWKIGIASVVALINVIWIVSRSDDTSIKTAAKHARTLPAPLAVWSLEDQAYYWAYALYDYGQLQSRFNIPGHTVINAKVARTGLDELLPKVDLPTRTAIEHMMSPQGGVR